MNPGATMPLLEHLHELRSRLVRAILAAVVGMLLAYALSEPLFALLARPMVQAWNDAGLGPPELHFGNPIEPFFTYLKLSALAGLFIASPAIFYQLWMFVAPALYRRERRYTVAFTATAALLFIGGAAFGYFLVFPVAFRFFLGFARRDLGRMQHLLGDRIRLGVERPFALSPTLMMGEYFSLAWKLLLAFGVVFELPVVIVTLAAIGLVTHRSLWRFNRHAIVLTFLVGGILTPGPDVVSQLLMAGPLILLYNLSIPLALLVERRRQARSADLAAAPGAD